MLFVVCSTTVAQNVDALFEDANNFYKNENYKQALDLYKQIESTQKVSSELYFNLGNCHYLLNQLALSIYNYEKALRLNPLNEDAKNNLLIAKKLTIDRIETLPQTLLQKINNRFIQKLHYNTWAYFSVLFSALSCLFFILFYLSHMPTKKRLFFSISLICFSFLIISLYVSYRQFNLFKNKKEAIVFALEIPVKNAPTVNSDQIFTLHEGTKIFVLDTLDDWKKIKLADGKIGWLKGDAIQIIDNF